MSLGVLEGVEEGGGRMGKRGKGWAKGVVKNAHSWILPFCNSLLTIWVSSRLSDSDIRDRSMSRDDESMGRFFFGEGGGCSRKS